VRWLVELEVWGPGYTLPEAARAAGHTVTAWTGTLPAGGPLVFHGSLELAARLAPQAAFCATDALRCSAWYPRAARWLLHSSWQLTTVRALVQHPPERQTMFVRPDSPLKPFAGRVLPREGLSMAALDFGFYYDDPELPVIVAPVREVGREWRYVVVDRQVVAGSAYDPVGRRALPDGPGAPWQLAEQIAREMEPPELVYTLDLCESEGELHLLELNPFSGADLYACDATAVVEAVAAVVGRS
jgi:hypothetical protein